MVAEAKVNTLTVIMMEVPCCGGILQMTKQGVEQSGRKVPIKVVTVGIAGKILQEEWV
jgi:hypothetical protein